MSTDPTLPPPPAEPVRITVPALSLVALVGPSGCGKSTFARRHFRATEVLSSDACRAMVSDDETDQSVTPQAFEVLNLIAAKRLALGRLTVVDATNVRPEARAPLTDRRTPKRTCPAYDSPDYAFRSRRAVESDDGGPRETETKYRCKVCGHEWKVRAPAGRAA